MSTTFIVALLAVLGLWALIWKRSGMSAGRAFGNHVADHIGIPRNLFHSLLDNGVNGPTLALLSTLEKAGLSVQQASVELGPSLARGVSQLELRFGAQAALEDAKPKITRLVTQWEARTQT